MRSFKADATFNFQPMHTGVTAGTLHVFGSLLITWKLNLCLKSIAQRKGIEAFLYTRDRPRVKWEATQARSGHECKPRFARNESLTSSYIIMVSKT